MSADAPTLFLETSPGKFHVEDPWTSKATARDVAVRVGTDRYRVLERLVAAGANGRTAFELGAELGLLAHVAGTRLGELVAAGYAAPLVLEGARQRRHTDTGRTALVYGATGAGATVLKAAEATLAPRTADATRSAGQRPPGRPSGPPRPSPRGLVDMRDRVLEAIVDAGLEGRTDDELGAELELLPTAAGTYRKALERLELVVRTDRTRRTRAGRRAGVHIATADGYVELERLVDATAAR
jgi:hypothetical protein